MLSAALQGTDPTDDLAEFQVMCNRHAPTLYRLILHAITSKRKSKNPQLAQVKLKKRMMFIMSLLVFSYSQKTDEFSKMIGHLLQMRRTPDSVIDILNSMKISVSVKTLEREELEFFEMYPAFMQDIIARNSFCMFVLTMDDYTNIHAWRSARGNVLFYF